MRHGTSPRLESLRKAYKKSSEKARSGRNLKSAKKYLPRDQSVEVEAGIQSSSIDAVRQAWTRETGESRKNEMKQRDRSATKPRADGAELRHARIKCRLRPRSAFSKEKLAVGEAMYSYTTDNEDVPKMSELSLEGATTHASQEMLPPDVASEAHKVVSTTSTTATDQSIQQSITSDTMTKALRKQSKRERARIHLESALASGKTLNTEQVAKLKRLQTHELIQRMCMPSPAQPKGCMGSHLFV